MSQARSRDILVGLLIVIVICAVYAILFVPPVLTIDDAFQLQWAHDIAHGFTPDYGTYRASTPHPLMILISLLALPLGSAAPAAIAWLTFALFACLLLVIYKIGRELFNPAVGLLAAAVVATRPAIVQTALATFQDIPFVLLVCLALLLELRRPHRGWPVLALLAIAGLMRPEAWVVSGLYWLYLALPRGGNPRPAARELVGLAAIVASAPVLWAISDLAVTGDALHSFHGTKALAADLHRDRSPADAPKATLRYLARTLRPPLIVGVPVACVYLWICARRQGAWLLGLAGVMAIVFMLTSLGGLPLLPRYVLTPAVLLAIVYAAGVFGWRSLPDEFPNRSRWKWIGVALLALSVLWLPWNLKQLHAVNRSGPQYVATLGDLREFGRSPAVRGAYAACGPISTNYWPIEAYVRYDLGGPPGSVRALADPANTSTQLLLDPANAEVMRNFSGVKENDVNSPLEPTGLKRIARSNFFELYATPECAAKLGAVG